MTENNEIAETLLSRESIVSRAREKWDAKPSAEKVRSSHKYKHIFEKLGVSNRVECALEAKRRGFLKEDA